MLCQSRALGLVVLNVCFEKSSIGYLRHEVVITPRLQQP